MIASRLRAAHHIAPSTSGLVNRLSASRDLTTWSATATVTYDQVGIDGAANTASLCTDVSTTAIQSVSHGTVAIGTTDTVRLWLKKTSAPGWCMRLRRAYQGGTTKYALTTMDPYTGELSRSMVGINLLEASCVLINGWWVIAERTSQNAGNTTIFVTLYPTVTTTPGGSNDVTLTGSITVGQIELYDNVSIARLWRTPPVYTP